MQSLRGIDSSKNDVRLNLSHGCIYKKILSQIEFAMIPRCFAKSVPKNWARTQGKKCKMFMNNDLRRRDKPAAMPPGAKKCPIFMHLQPQTQAGIANRQ
jgi:hypothetical protein